MKTAANMTFGNCVSVMDFIQYYKPVPKKELRSRLRTIKHRPISLNTNERKALNLLLS